MDLRIVTCVHGRHEVLKAFLHHIEWLRNETGYALPISVAYSDDADFDLIKDCDHVLKIENNPVGRKWNELFKAVHYETCDSHFMCLGSDDFLNANYLNTVHPHTELDHFGVDSGIFYSPMHSKAVEFKVTNPNFKLIGAGRVISRKVLDAVFFNNKNLYEPRLNKGLDNNSEAVMKKHGFEPVLLDFRHAFIDVKTKENIHSFDEFNHCESVELDLVNEIMPSVSFG